MRIITPLLLFALCFCVQGGPSAESIIPEVPISGHPRLLLNDRMKTAIQHRIKNDSLYRVWHGLILKAAGRLLERPAVTVEKKGRRMLEPAREFNKRILVLGYAWQFTGEPAYLRQAVRELESVCRLPDWNPEHFLDAAEMTFGASIGYDWFHQALTADQKDMLRSAIIEKGLKPSLLPGNNHWLQRDTNWNQVCNSSMLMGALAVFEEDPDLTRPIVVRSVESNQKALDAYGPDGAYSEGYGYWSYGTHFQVMMLAAWETAFGQTSPAALSEGFLKTPHYILHLSGPSGRSFNYSDSEDRIRMKPSMFWLAARTGDQTLLHTEQKMLQHPVAIPARDLVFLMLWSEPEQFRNRSEPAQRSWIGRGANPVVTMRSGWKADDWFIGIKGGSPSSNHGHMDAGSFVLDAAGERWAIDTGTEDYNELESHGLKIWSYSQESDRWKVTRFQTRAHSTLMADDQEQRVDGFADFKTVKRETGRSSASVDLTSLYAPALRSATRNFMLQDQSLEITDHIENGSGSTRIVWRMVTDADVEERQPKHLKLSKNGKEIHLAITSNRSCAIRVNPLTPRYDFESLNPNVKLIEVHLDIPANRTVYIHAILSPIPVTP